SPSGPNACVGHVPLPGVPPTGRRYVRVGGASSPQASPLTQPTLEIRPMEAARPRPLDTSTTAPAGSPVVVPAVTADTIAAFAAALNGAIVLPGDDAY